MVAKDADGKVTSHIECTHVLKETASWSWMQAHDGKGTAGLVSLRCSKLSEERFEIANLVLPSSSGLETFPM